MFKSIRIVFETPSGRDRSLILRVPSAPSDRVLIERACQEFRRQRGPSERIVSVITHGVHS